MSVALVVFGGFPAFAEAAPAATPEALKSPGPPATYYAAWGLAILAGILVIAVVAGYLFQARGFREGASERR